MKRSHITPMPDYYGRYINLVPDVELSDAFEQSLRELDSLERDSMKRLGEKTYAPGKWTVKEILQHLTDVERISSYRTLLYARKDDTIPAGFEPDFLANNSNANRRTIDELVDELRTVRASTISLFDSFDPPALLSKGVCWKYEMTVLAMGFMIIGHQIHHLGMIESKYYPLDGS